MHRHSLETICHTEIFHLAWNMVMECKNPGLEAIHKVLQQINSLSNARPLFGLDTFRDIFYGIMSRQDQEFRSPCSVCPRVVYQLADNTRIRAIACEALAMDGTRFDIGHNGELKPVESPDEHAPTVRSQNLIPPDLRPRPRPRPRPT